ncbi:MAG: redoxin domain-containing protein [Bacteroidetes bacterium]|nr:redoxin domain-containing protein [Bacteroidota bacterium]
MTKEINHSTRPLSEVMHEMITNEGNSLLDRSRQKPVLLVFLRQFGCTFCREALADLSKKQKGFQDRGLDIIYVHMSDKETATQYFERYSIEDPVHIGDPECEYYKAFGLTKGNFTQLFGLNTWIRGFSAGVVAGHGIGNRQLGDGFQMPGIFVIRDGEIQEKFIHKLASDRPDYEELVQCCGY